MSHRPEQGQPEQRPSASAGMAAMTMMMVCCLGVVLVLLAITRLDWPLGLLVGVGAAAALLGAHQLLMRRGGHH